MPFIRWMDHCTFLHEMCVCVCVRFEAIQIYFQFKQIDAVGLLYL